VTRFWAILLVTGCAGSFDINKVPPASPPRESFGPWQIKAKADVRLTTPQRGPGAAAAWLFLHAYQHTLSRADGQTCRFHPTCSGFAVDAVSELGILGLPFVFGRLGRPHNDESFYPMSSDHQHLEDPLSAYLFFLEDDRPDTMRDDPRFGWYHHVHAMQGQK